MLCYRLNFSAPFHVYRRGDASYRETGGFIHSDTLSAAILAVWSRIAPEQAKRQAENPSFKLSSAFPFYKKYYFLPRALNSEVIGLEAEQLSQAKTLQKIRWLESRLWHETLRDPARLKNIDFQQDIRQGVLAAPASDLPQTLWIAEERPRFTLDRISHRSIGKINHATRVWFAEGGGLYFLALFDDESSQKQFETVLEVLADSGIGADRGDGNGLFHWQAGENPGLQTSGTGKAIALSLVNPADRDFQNGWLDGAAYRLIRRDIWTGGEMPRRTLDMFSEGSVFAKPLQGRIIRVSPKNASHTIFRDGRGFFAKAD